MNRVLVTGAGGFVGRHLCARLVQEGCQVRGSVRRAGRSALPAGVETFSTGSLETFDDWDLALDGVSEVVHLAARAHVIRETSRNSLQAYRRVNVEATARLLEACADSAVRRVVFMSSIGAVGRSFETPCAEDHACQPEDEYGQTKREAELLFEKPGSSQSFETVILRPPLVYGPDVGGNFLRILRLVSRGVPLPVGGLTNKRSMVSVTNLVDAVCHSLAHPHAGGQTFHVADEECLSTRELVQVLAEALERPNRSVTVPRSLLRLGGLMTGRSKDVSRLSDPLLVDSTRIREQLQWEQPVSARTALAETAQAFLETTQTHTRKAA